MALSAINGPEQVQQGVKEFRLDHGTVRRNAFAGAVATPGTGLAHKQWVNEGVARPSQSMRRVLS
jgi:hypothetical protein